MSEVSKEFAFIRDKIERVASLLCSGNSLEAAFMMGCIQNICHVNSIKYDDIKEKPQTRCS